MTIWMKPTLTDEKIEAMEPLEAFRYAEDLLESRFPREAARVLRPVAELEPRNAAVCELMGRAHFAAAHLGPAEQAFRTLTELEPTSAWAQKALGLALDRQSRHREGAVHHRLAAAMGASERDATRVELVDRPGA
ncbi:MULTISPECIES: tetratricopeptide repeat protein [Aeromicrobium]|uniref:tetratricopeptide repeat protein n=1 Tax=Aeromicrobium TaxID=2040 RepID=UPI00257F7FF4|nr:MULTISPECIES: tetratricopeptide repeat protein [Aeromicrobium]